MLLIEWWFSNELRGGTPILIRTHDWGCHCDPVTVTLGPTVRSFVEVWAKHSVALWSSVFCFKKLEISPPTTGSVYQIPWSPRGLFVLRNSGFQHSKGHSKRAKTKFSQSWRLAYLRLILRGRYPEAALEVRTNGQKPNQQTPEKW